MTELHRRAASRRARRGWAGLVLLAGSPLLAGCPNAGEDRVLSIPGTAVVTGVVYLDVDGDRSPGSADAPMSGVRVRLVVAGTLDTVARGTSLADGTAPLGVVPVGRYTVVVPGEPTLFGDSLSVVRVDTASLVLGAADTVDVRIGVGYPVLSLAAARAEPIGRKILISGIALNGSATFGDSTVHLSDTSGALRITGVRGAVVTQGDSVRVLGRTGARDGQPVLADGAVTLVALVNLPAAERVTTAAADTADGGRLDARIVRIANATINATISDTSSTGVGDFVLVVDDGSGALRVVFDDDALLTTAGYEPGVVIDATGVLVPTGTGTWILKPRSDSDVSQT